MGGLFRLLTIGRRRRGLGLRCRMRFLVRGPGGRGLLMVIRFGWGGRAVGLGRGSMSLCGVMVRGIRVLVIDHVRSSQAGNRCSVAFLAMEF